MWPKSVYLDQLRLCAMKICKVGQDAYRDFDEAVSFSLTDVGIHLHSAFTQCGFVYLTNHGIDSADVSRVFDSSKTFFHLSNDQKRQSLRDQVTTQGWVQPGQEMLDALKEENGQQVSVWETDNDDMFMYHPDSRLFMSFASPLTW